MTAQSAEGVTFTFAGQTIGGVLSWDVVSGQPREAVHRPLNARAVTTLPGMPDYGTCVLNLIRDRSDAGQIALLNSLKNRTKHTLTITYASGQADSFEAFCQVLPVAGSRTSQTPVNSSAVRIRLSGPYL